MNFQVTDVGGARSERMKWINCFDGVSAILFVASLTDYDDFRIEPPLGTDQLTTSCVSRGVVRNRITRMDECLALFNLICDSIYFRNTSILLFMNKIDAFMKRIETSPLSKIFINEYNESDDKDLKMASFFILKKYLARTVTPSSRCEHIYCHFSCAVGALGNTEFVLNAVTDMIIRAHLESIGLY